MRTINGKLFLGMLLGSVVLTGSAFGLHYFQYQRIGKALLWQARRAEQEGQTARMARYLQRYLEFNPRDNDEKANLAKAWTTDAFAGNARSRARAARLLDEVLTWKDDPGLRRLLVKTALEVRDFKMARDHLQRLLAWKDMEETLKADRRAQGQLRAKKTPLPDSLVRPDPALGELERYWGQVQEEDKRPAEALACYRLAVRHAPEVTAGYVRLAYLLRRHNKTDPTQHGVNCKEADGTIDRLVAVNATSPDAYLARWRYRRTFDLLAIRETGNHGQILLEDAVKDVVEAVRRKVESVEALLEAADMERLLGRAEREKVDGTVAQRRAGWERHSREALGYLRRGLELARRERTPAAEASEFQLLWHKGNLLMDEVEFDRMLAAEDGSAPGVVVKGRAAIEEVIGTMRKSRVPAAGDYMEGRMLVFDGRWSEAARRFERARALLAAQPDLANQADLYLGQCYYQLGEYTQMYNAFKRVFDWDPTSAPAQMGMAAARWAQGQLEDAEKLYIDVMKQKRVPPRGWIDIARLEIQRQVGAARPDWKRAEQALENATKFNAANQVEVCLLRAEVLALKGEMGKARELLRAGRSAAGPRKAVDLWVGLAELELREKKLEAARAVLDEAREKLGDQVGLRLAEARYALTAKAAGVKEKLAELGEGRAKFSEDEQARLLGGLADVHLRLGNYDAARRLWDALAGLPKQKTNLRLRVLLFDVALEDGNVEEMRRALAAVRALEPANGPYQLHRGARMALWEASRPGVDPAARAAKLKQARRDLEQVLGQRRSWPPVYLARAELAELNGNQEEVVQNLGEAVKYGEKSATVYLHLARLLQGQGKRDQARVLLAQAQKEAGASPELTRMLLGQALRDNDIPEALKIARARMQENTKDPQELMWWGELLLARKDLAGAGQKFDQAIAHANGNPAPWVVKTQFLVDQKKEAEALALIARAKKELPPGKAPLVLGLCYDTVRKPKEARACYAEALEKKRDVATVKAVVMAHLSGGRLDEAEPLLQEIVDGKVGPAPAGDVAWARRTLAIVLAAGNDYRRFERALALVGLKLGGGGRLAPDEGPDESTENRRAKARVLASQPGQRQFRLKAIALLEELGRQNALADDDKFVLATLLEAEGRSRDSDARFGELAQQKVRTPQYLARYGMSLVQRKTPEALAKVRQIVGWLRELEKARGAGPNGFASVELEARLLEAEGKGDEAIDLLEQHAFRKGAKPEEVLLVLAAMSRQRKYARAFSMCEKAWKQGRCPPEAVGGVSVGLMRVMNPTPAQVKEIEGWLRKAVEKKPESVVLRMHLADLYDQAGEYRQAARAYQKILERDPNNVVALNNLAWLLALHKGDADEALRHIERAVSGMGRRADLLDTRGLVHLKLRHGAQALADFEEATGEAPTPTRLYHLARAYHLAGKRDRAREALRKAKAGGLQAARLHPVEQDDCRELLKEYELQ
jgi:tetratricopeptide (TPR) repeat protein